MRKIYVLLFVSFFSISAVAGSSEKVNVELVNIDRSSIDVTLVATPDHRFSVADKQLKLEEIKAFLATQPKPVKYVFVSGQDATIGDLVAIAHIGEALGFTALFETKGQLKSLRVMK